MRDRHRLGLGDATMIIKIPNAGDSPRPGGGHCNGFALRPPISPRRQRHPNMALPRGRVSYCAVVRQIHETNARVTSLLSADLFLQGTPLTSER